MPPEASAEKALLESQEVKSLLLSPVYDSSGKTFGFLGFDNVVSTGKWSDAASTILRMSSEIIGNAIERKRAEEALKRQKAYFQQLFDNSPDAIVLLDDTDRIVQVNKGFEALFGYQIEEVKGRFINDVVVPEDRTEEASAMSRATLNNQVVRKETVRKRKDGSLVDVSTVGYPIRFGNKVVGVYVIYSDITERKRAEEERRELEHRAYLTSRLASIGEMAAGIAHEINNPLTAVIGFAQLVMDANIPDDVKKDIAVIYKEAQRAAEVAKNLLVFARKREPARQPTDINGAIREVLKLRAYEQKVNNIQVNTRLDPKLPAVMADYSQLQQVFLNIIINAESAMLEAHNGGTLTVTTQKVNDTSRVSFTDNGLGIAKENLERVFDPFFTTKEVGKGTGLGLSLCHGIVVQHGGRIYARSKLGKGATFVVELPINAH
jgi:PAS domain S-box-containing protein